jgi:hypothetical protein
MATSWLRQMGWPQGLIAAIMISWSMPTAGPGAS